MEQIQTPEIKKKTIRGILWQKFLLSLEVSTLKKNIQSLGKFIAVFCITLLLIDPTILLWVLEPVFKWSNFALLKFLGVYGLVTYRKPIRKHLKRILKRPTTLMIDGIPHVELLDHLFTIGSFKRDDVKRKFGIPHHRYQSLAKKLESLNILVRGENNARVLNDKYSRQDVALTLAGKRSSKSLEEVLKPNPSGEGGMEYTTEPMKESIEERVKNYLHDSPPQFTLKSLNG